MILSSLRLSSKTKLRVILSVGVITTILLLSIQPAAASAPPVQIETSADVEEPMPGERVTINTEISNLKNNNDKNVVVRYVFLRKGGSALDTYRQSEDVGAIAPGGSLTIPFSLKFDSSGQKHFYVEITVSQEGEDSIHTYKKPIYIDVTDSDLRGDVRLTSNSVSGSNTVTIEGDAANIGGTDVDSVLLSIPNTDLVSPRPPNGEYYVGGIETSEFGTFELTADIANGTDSVPVEITYITTSENRDDERVTKTQRIPVTDTSSGLQQAQQAQATATNGPPSGGGPPILLIGGVAVLVVISILGVVLWRRQ